MQLDEDRRSQRERLLYLFLLWTFSVLFKTSDFRSSRRRNVEHLIHEHGMAVLRRPRVPVLVKLLDPADLRRAFRRHALLCRTSEELATSSNGPFPSIRWCRSTFLEQTTVVHAWRIRDLHLRSPGDLLGWKLRQAPRGMGVRRVAQPNPGSMRERSRDSIIFVAGDITGWQKSSSNTDSRGRRSTSPWK